MQIAYDFCYSSFYHFFFPVEIRISNTASSQNKEISVNTDLKQDHKIETPNATAKLIEDIKGKSCIHRSL